MLSCRFTQWVVVNGIEGQQRKVGNRHAAGRQVPHSTKEPQ